MNTEILINGTETMESLPRQTGSSMRSIENIGLLKTPPLVKPEQLPSEIMADVFGCPEYELENMPDYQSIARLLDSYGHHQHNITWTDYVRKTDSRLRDLMAQIFRTCRENGFYRPHTAWVNGKLTIVFDQMVRPKKQGKSLYLADPPDLCYLCEHETCADTDEYGRYRCNINKCWHRIHRQCNFL